MLNSVLLILALTEMWVFLYALEKAQYKYHKTQRSVNTNYKDTEVYKSQKVEVMNYGKC